MLLLPFMRDWVTAVLNARGENSGLLYSLTPTALASPLIPILAWLGRTRPGRGARGPGAERTAEPAAAPAGGEATDA